MDKSKLSRLRELVDAVINAPTKKDAKPLIRRLEFMYSHLYGDIDGYLYIKLGEVIDYAKTASGKAKDKEHWISCAEQCWYTFENGVKAKIVEDS